MREILFRGKTNEGKWVEGQLLHFKASVGSGELAVIVEGCEWDNSNEWFNLGKRAKVLPETVGQFTGLTDKNGKKIFDGDIVRADDYIFSVKYGQCGGVENAETYGYMEFYLEAVSERTKLCAKYGLRDAICYFTNIRVIGNIHDNPEIL